MRVIFGNICNIHQEKIYGVHLRFLRVNLTFKRIHQNQIFVISLLHIVNKAVKDVHDLHLMECMFKYGC